MENCKKCLIPDIVPEVTIDKDGICNYCSEYVLQNHEQTEQARITREEDLEKALAECRNVGQYDCLVPFSGGKDSIYLLYLLKVKYGLNVLAFTTNVNIPELAWNNIRRTLKTLDIPHISHTPPSQVYRKLFRYLLQNQEERGAVYTVSYVYAPLFEGDAIQIAIEKEIPLVLAGYSPGQPEPTRMLYEFSPKLIRKTDWTPPHLRECGYFSDSELEIFFNPQNCSNQLTFPRYLAPYHAWVYDQDETMKKVVELKLVASSVHASPILSNYPINWLLMYSDLKNFGYNPYTPEFSSLIREGKASLAYWRIMSPTVNFMIRKKILLGHQVRKSMKWLNLKDEDLNITLPHGAYDPKFD